MRIEDLARPMRRLMWNLRAIRASLFMLIVFGCGFAVASDEYPNKPIKLIIPAPAGGPADVVGRLYAKTLSKYAGQPVVVENPGGASGVIGVGIAQRAQPDGHTILLGVTSTMAGINHLFMKNLTYEYARDFSTIGLIANAPHVLAVRTSLPAQSYAEFAALTKQSPGKYTFASAGPGTIVQMGGELVKYYGSLDIMHVPFKGGAPATMAVIAGDVDMTVNDLTTLATHIKSGKLRALAVAAKSRLKPLPDVPTFAELGLPKVISSTWWGAAVPKGTSADVQSKLRAFHAKAIADPEFVSSLEAMAVEPLSMSAGQIVTFIDEETKKWKEVANAAGIGRD